MRFLYFLGLIFSLSACGEGESSGNNISSDHSELLYLNGHTVNDIVKLENNTLWIIVGLSADAGTITEGEKDVIIYDNPNDFGQPDQGVRGKYYVFINNSADSFYINPIPTPTILKEGSVELATLSVGAIAVLDDDSVWQVKGLERSAASSASFDYTLYRVKRNFLKIIPPITGELSEWYLYNEAAPMGYYLAPLIEANIIWQGFHTFYSEGLNDTIRLSDGSLWLITGTLDSDSSATGEHSIKLIENIKLVEEPVAGDKAETIMYISGHETAFYVKEI